MTNASFCAILSSSLNSAPWGCREEATWRIHEGRRYRRKNLGRLPQRSGSPLSQRAQPAGSREPPHLHEGGGARPATRGRVLWEGSGTLQAPEEQDACLERDQGVAAQRDSCPARGGAPRAPTAGVRSAPPQPKHLTDLILYNFLFFKRKADNLYQARL